MQSTLDRWWCECFMECFALSLSLYLCTCTRARTSFFSDYFGHDNNSMHLTIFGGNFMTIFATQITIHSVYYHCELSRIYCWLFPPLFFQIRTHPLSLCRSRFANSFFFHYYIGYFVLLFVVCTFFPINLMRLNQKSTIVIAATTAAIAAAALFFVNEIIIFGNRSLCAEWKHNKLNRFSGCTLSKMDLYWGKWNALTWIKCHSNCIKTESTHRAMLCIAVQRVYVFWAACIAHLEK